MEGGREQYAGAREADGMSVLLAMSVPPKHPSSKPRQNPNR